MCLTRYFSHSSLLYGITMHRFCMWDMSTVNSKYFELKNLWRPKLKLLASNGVAIFVMPFSITLNARYTRQTDTHMHTQTHTRTRTDTPTHRHRHTHTDTHTTHTYTHTHTHNMCCVYVCACVCTWQSTNLYMITPCNG